MSQHDVSVAPARPGEPPANAVTEERRHRETPGGMRATDLEPYTGLRYLSTLFRIMAIILVLLLLTEVVAGLATRGSAAIPTLLAEASRLIVLAGLLWGAGDLAVLLVDIGHDLRATRILLGRQLSHPSPEPDRASEPVLPGNS